MRKAIETLPVSLQEGKSFLLGGCDVAASFTSCLRARTKSFQSLIGKAGDFSLMEWIRSNIERIVLMSNSGDKSESAAPV